MRKHEHTPSAVVLSPRKMGGVILLAILYHIRYKVHTVRIYPRLNRATHPIVPDTIVGIEVHPTLERRGVILYQCF